MIIQRHSPRGFIATLGFFSHMLYHHAPRFGVIPARRFDPDFSGLDV